MGRGNMWKVLLVMCVMCVMCENVRGFINTSDDNDNMYEQFLNLRSSVDETLALQPNATRNYRITATYQALSRVFVDLTHTNGSGPMGFVTPWPGLACVASGTVGAGIRMRMANDWVRTIAQDLPPDLVALLEAFPDLANVILKPVLEVVSLALSSGNELVFREIGRTFTDFGVAFANATRATAPQRWAAFNATLDPVSQALLVSAFHATYEATFVLPQEDVVGRTQRLFYANMLVGIDEQTRLQPALEEAFLANVTFHVPLVDRNFTVDLAPFMTLVFTFLALPQQTLYIRDDMPARLAVDGGGLFAPHLSQISWAPALSTYSSYVPDLGDYRGTGADDWAVLFQRLRYILALFRSRQDDERFDSCSLFTPHQLQLIWNNQMIPEKDMCQFTYTCCANKPPQ